MGSRLRKNIQDLRAERPELSHTRARDLVLSRNTNLPDPWGRDLWLAANGIDDVDTWNPAQKWERFGYHLDLTVPLGQAWSGDQADPQRETEIVTLNVEEPAHGGSGPHGVLSGMTGSGKRTLLHGFLGSLIVRNSPYELRIIHIDCKDSRDAGVFDGVPHFAGAFFDMESDPLAAFNLSLAVEAEIIRRQKILRKAGAQNVRVFAAMHPNECLPDVILVVDELYELCKKDPNGPIGKILSKLAAVGRALGFHILIGCQFFDPNVTSDAAHHIMYSVSLTQASAEWSRRVIGTDAAYHMRKGGGQALVRSMDDAGEHVLRGFFAFNPVGGSEQESDLTRAMARVKAAEVDAERLSYGAEGFVEQMARLR